MIGIKAEFGGYESTKVTFANAFSSATAAANLFTYNVGPVVKLRSGHFEPFAEALFGGARIQKARWHCGPAGNCSTAHDAATTFLHFVLQQEREVAVLSATARRDGGYVGIASSFTRRVLERIRDNIGPASNSYKLRAPDR